jgi:hypothetical protein
MKPFDYISVLLSIVLSLALAHVLASAAHVIQHGLRRGSALLAFWIAVIVYMVIDFWLSVWHLHDQSAWSLPFIIFLLVQVSLLYVAARIATPEGRPDAPIDMVAHFEATRRRLFEVLAVYMVFAFAANQFIPGFGTLELKIIALSYVVLFFAASRFSGTNAQRAIAAAVLGLTVYYSVRYMAGI